MDPKEFYAAVVSWGDPTLRPSGFKRRKVEGYKSSASTWLKTISPPPPFPEPDRIVVHVQLLGDTYSDYRGGQFRLELERGQRANVDSLLSNEEVSAINRLQLRVIDKLEVSDREKKQFRGMLGDRRMSTDFRFLDLSDVDECLKIIEPELVKWISG